jgi:hypothetical protein
VACSAPTRVVNPGMATTFTRIDSNEAIFKRILDDGLPECPHRVLPEERDVRPRRETAATPNERGLSARIPLQRGTMRLHGHGSPVLY